ncbi:hypothetical protein ZIOFF_052343 [Zingiber officinale]|uniref:Uncharacterized protein n=1 Tax=Zingiber officinale TaxID=94328 RepID=A0A8J5KNE9_ZINOF|nr:hypothetical protein ZIOFF_052343 [Zingiber officinale]
MSQSDPGQSSWLPGWALPRHQLNLSLPVGKRKSSEVSTSIDRSLTMSFIFGKRKTPAGVSHATAEFCSCYLTAFLLSTESCKGFEVSWVLILVAELLRENKRMLDKSIREIERERQGLQAQEKKLIVEIKKTAKQGQMAAVKVMAKDLIRTRHQITKFYALKSQLQGVSLRIQVNAIFEFYSLIHSVKKTAPLLLVFGKQHNALTATLKSTQAMGEAMKGVTKAMGQMNKQMNLPALQRIMQEFEMQNEKMEMVSEVMGDAIDDALEGDEEEEETEELVNQVLDEIGIDINSEVDPNLVKAPSTAVTSAEANKKVAQVEAASSEGGGIVDDLQARLDNLRKM